ncbi:unnamed protein product [Rotaria magnacalcarata]|uniref:H15 domain-containing protein n=4 Tax=Rotaria magnacalcarata TaxID=392030 RepID=A0A816TUI2_9BILA|nr:unnamed protein product [Rotaria magnacalcarata]CAF1566647.1 unnamed protein product [Rotaria magnacalcarata]CAF2101022.1 unnamed protein product [Rotaria magnacalcarata]CAF3818982.1 unnamed protein product [Rotaria magnacalcarata]CAF3828382.1 unnamed protein product [Rotaria magnacalcarata]
MAPTKKVSSRSKSSSQSPKKPKIGSPMKKKLSHTNASPKKSTAKASDVRNVTTTRHPNYQQMVTEAIKTLDSRTGSSRSKILNHIKVTYGIEGGKTSNNHLRAALKALLEESVISLAKGTGYINGYYRIVSKGKKQNNKKSSSQSTTAVHDKKPSDKPRSQSKSGNKSKTDGQRRSRSSSKIQAKSTNKNRSSGRKSDQSTVSRSRSPIKKSKGDDQKSNQAHQSRSRSITKSRNSMTKQPTEKPKSPQRGRAKVGQKRQALKEVNDNQKSVNKSKQTRSRSSKRKSTGNNNVTSSPTKQARTSTGFRSKKGGK